MVLLNYVSVKDTILKNMDYLTKRNLPDVIDREFEKEVIVEDNSKIEELQNEIYILKGKLEDKKGSRMW